MKPQYINLIRDAALKLEKQDLQLAHDLMSLAHEKRPGGQFIKRKLREYQNILYNNEYKKLKNLFDSGELVIIPSGFRCYTKVRLFDSLGLESVSLPFDSGYFPPISIVNILKHRKVELCSDNHNVTHYPCIKFEHSKDAKLGNGIKFETSTYEEINNSVKDKKQQNINQYLDATFGYYTLDKTNKYVLAHFNWHPFADEEKSKGSYDISTNIKRFNVMMNRRIERMFEMCNNAKYVLFVTANHQDYQYMTIDNDVFELNDYELLSTTVKDTFGDKCIVSNFSEVSSASKILELFGISK